MGKRKRSRSRDRDYDHIIRRLKKLSKRRRRSSSRESENNSYRDSRHYDDKYNYDEYEYDRDTNNKDYQGCYNSDDYENEAGLPDLLEPGTSTSAAIDSPALGALIPPCVPTASLTQDPQAAAESVSPAQTAQPAQPAQTEHPAQTVQIEVHTPLTSAATCENLTESSNNENVPLLEPEILELLGEDPTQKKTFGENLHKDIASRWAHALSNGLDKGVKVELIKSYQAPENCPSMRAPILNLEVKAALSEMNLKNDLYSQSKQNQLSSSLAAIGQVLNWALSPANAVPQNIIKTLSDAGRLICDSHFKESQSRRFSALSHLNKTMRDTVKNTKIDEYLFGSALTEHIKSSKAIIKTGAEMKSVAMRPPHKPTPPVATQQGRALNARGAPPRVPPAAQPRPPPAPRRPPRDRRMDATRGRRSTKYSRQHTKRRY